MLHLLEAPAPSSSQAPTLAFGPPILNACAKIASMLRRATPPAPSPPAPAPRVPELTLPLAPPRVAEITLPVAPPRVPEITLPLHLRGCHLLFLQKRFRHLSFDLRLAIVKTSVPVSALVVRPDSILQNQFNMIQRLPATCSIPSQADPRTLMLSYVVLTALFGLLP
jgi:hypothetical protein